jgi:hypothetical protein
VLSPPRTPPGDGYSHGVAKISLDPRIGVGCRNKRDPGGILELEMRFFTIRRRTTLPDQDPIELAALLDGSLASRRRATLEQRVETSAELAGLLEEQALVRALVRKASAGVAAPADLRRRIAAERPARRSPPTRRRLVVGSGLAAAALATALLQVSGDASPTIVTAAGLSTRSATGPAPGLQPRQPKLLAREVDGVSFPNWRRRFGWRAIGVRADRLAGRDTTTVFYEKKGRRLGYTIVAGPPLADARGAMHVVRAGTGLQTFVVNGRLVVTWRRDGRTCVLSGAGVARVVLIELAAWKGKGAVPF